MAYARTAYTYNGTNLFTIDFPYLSEDHVEVFVEGVEATAFTFVNATSISIQTPALVNGDEVIIRRRTSPTAQIVDFEGDSVLKESDLDTAFSQMFYMAQEAMDVALAAGVVP